MHPILRKSTTTHYAHRMSSKKYGFMPSFGASFQVATRPSGIGRCIYSGPRGLGSAIGRRTWSGPPKKAAQRLNPGAMRE